MPKLLVTYKRKILLCCLIVSCTAKSLNEREIRLVLADSISIFWECKQVALEQAMQVGSIRNGWLLSKFRSIAPHEFSEYARKNILTDQALIVGNPLNTSNLSKQAIFQIRAVLNVQPEKGINIRQTVLYGLSELGYSKLPTSILMTYATSRKQFIGYALLFNDPFRPCFPVTLTKQIKETGQIIDQSKEVFYFRFLPQGEPQRLVKVSPTGDAVEDLLSGEQLGLYNSSGKRIKFNQMEIKVRPDLREPLYQDVHFKPLAKP